MTRRHTPPLALLLSLLLLPCSCMMGTQTDLVEYLRGGRDAVNEVVVEEEEVEEAKPQLAMVTANVKNNRDYLSSSTDVFDEDSEEFYLKLIAPSTTIGEEVETGIKDVYICYNIQYADVDGDYATYTVSEDKASPYKCRGVNGSLLIPLEAGMYIVSTWALKQGYEASVREDWSFSIGLKPITVEIDVSGAMAEHLVLALLRTEYLGNYPNRLFITTADGSDIDTAILEDVSVILQDGETEYPIPFMAKDSRNFYLPEQAFLPDSEALDNTAEYTLLIKVIYNGTPYTGHQQITVYR